MKCPKCEGTVSRGPGVIARQFGLIGALIGMAFASYECEKCGAIARSEFPPELRAQMTKETVIALVGALVVIGIIIAAVVAFA